MLVSKKKYDFLLARYEQAASRADLLERQLAELNGHWRKMADRTNAFWSAVKPLWRCPRRAVNRRG